MFLLLMSQQLQYSTRHLEQEAECNLVMWLAGDDAMMMSIAIVQLENHPVGIRMYSITPLWTWFYL